MKKITITLFAAFLALSLSAQDNTFLKGDKVANLAIGFGGGYYSGFSSGFTRTPFLSASLDVGVVDDVLDVGSIGVGGYVGFSNAKWESSSVWGTYGWKETHFVIGPRATFHYPLVDKLDTYAGIMIAYHGVSLKETGDWGGTAPYKGNSGGIYFSGFLGARYYFGNNFAVVAEVGSGSLAIANIGISIKF